MRMRCMGIGWAILLLVIWGVAGCAKQEQGSAAGAAGAQAAAVRPMLLFMTDFGTDNDAVPICKGVMLGIAPEARILDITHQVTPFSVEEAARTLSGVTPYYPAGTVFVVVVDPGVGTARKAVVVKTKKGQFFVAPDNGLLTPVIERDGLESAREITNKGWMIGDTVSSTFHGRDIFSPVGAHLVAGWDYTLVGPEVQGLVRLTPRVANATDKGIEGEVIGLDQPFGSLITDISEEEFDKLGYKLGEKVTMQLNKQAFSAPYVKTFMEVPVGEPLIYVDSRGRIGVAINQGNFGVLHKITPPVAVFVPKKGGRI